MAFNVSSISKFTNETSQELVKKAVLTGKTANLVTILPGVKYKETLNLLENTITVADASCGFNPAGSVAFSQRVIEVAPLEVKDSLCEKTLKDELGEDPNLIQQALQPRVTAENVQTSS